MPLIQQKKSANFPKHSPPNFSVEEKRRAKSVTYKDQEDSGQEGKVNDY